MVFVAPDSTSTPSAILQVACKVKAYCPPLICMLGCDSGAGCWEVENTGYFFWPDITAQSLQGRLTAAMAAAGLYTICKSKRIPTSLISRGRVE